MREVNIIVGMDRLNQFDALIDCRKKIVRFRIPSGGELTIWGEGSKGISTFCSAARARKYLQHGCEGFLSYVINARGEKKEATV